jgi:DNA-binding MltR family transcriptional regulator
MTTDTALEETRNTAYITALEDAIDQLEIVRSNELDGYVRSGMSKSIMTLRTMKLEKEQSIAIPPPP